MIETVDCNLCGSARTLPVARLAKQRIASVVCADCGLGYLSPRPHAGCTEALYAGYEQSYPDAVLLAPDNVFDRVARERAAAIGSRLAPGSRTIEIGSAYGHFLRALRDAGCDVQGFEPSAPQARFARRHFGLDRIDPRGIEALPGDASADLVAAFHVLEHLRDPRHALRRAWRALRPGGWLFLDLPDGLRLPADAIEHLYTAAGQHLHVFSARVLARLLHQSGFEVEWVGAHPLHGLYDANLRAIARRPGPGRRPRGTPPPADPAETVDALRRQRAGLRALRRRVRARVAAWRAAGRPIALYGGGFHSLGLLDLCDLGPREIRCVIDDDPRKHGRALGGIPIHGRARLHAGRRGGRRGREAIGAVLISSLAAEAGIARRLRAENIADLEIGLVYPAAHQAPVSERGAARRSDAAAAR